MQLVTMDKRMKMMISDFVVNYKLNPQKHCIYHKLQILFISNV